MSLAVLWLGAALAVGRAATPPLQVPQPLPTPQFRRYGVADGLPSSNVYMVTQDHRGFLWLGTRDGLARFDGRHFRVFHHDPRNPDSFPGNDVSNVMVDRRGRVWAGGEGTGLNLYVDALQGFRHWRHDPKDPASLSGDDVWALAQTGDGSIWVGTFAGGVNRLRKDGRGFDHLRHRKDDPDSLSSDIILSLHAGDDGRLWIGTLTGLDLRLPDGQLRHVSFPGLKSPPRVWHVDGHGEDVRASTSVGLFVVGPDLVARRVAPDVLPELLVFQSLRRPSGTLWVATRAGLYWLRPDGSHGHLAAHPLLPGALPGRLVNYLLTDHEGGLWVAMQDGGLAYLPPSWRTFTHFAHVPDVPSSLVQSRILALAAAAPGMLLVGGPDGQLDRLDVRTGKVEHLGQRFSSAPQAITAIAPAGKGFWWISMHAGLLLFDGHHVRTIDLHTGVQRIASDAQGNAYAAAPTRGIFRIDRHTLAVTLVGLASDTSESTATRGLAEHDGELWRASPEGVSRFDAKAQRFQFVPGIERGWVQAFTFDGQGLWLALKNGLQHYQYTKDGWALDRRVGVAEGWPSPLVHAMTADSQGRVWLFSENGMWRYDPAKRAFRNFGVDDGLPSAEFTSFDVVRMGDGTVYTGTLGGVFGFRPDTQVDHAQAPAVALDSITVRRDGHVVSLPLSSRRIPLRWNDHELRVSVRALSFIDPNRNHYRFRLLGFDPGWVGTGVISEREISGLGAGDYTLLVEAAGPGNVWGALATPLTISVSRPPWLRPWAWAAYALVVLVLGWMLMRLWQRRLEQRHRMRLADEQRRMAEEASAAKTQFLATLGHEIRTPMTGVLGMAELLLRSPLDPKQRENAETILRSGTLLLKLVNDALDLARIEARRFELEVAPFDPAALVREVVQLESGVAERKGLELKVLVEEGVPATVLGDAMRIKQVLLNLTNNALKFTEQGNVELRLSREDNGLRFRVADTGSGIPAASRERLFQRFEQEDGPQRRAGSGLGLAICRELVALMGGRIRLDSHVAQGSVFDVWLPLTESTAAPAKSAAPQAAVRALDILLVEDDATVAAVIQGLLEEQGHRVVHAANGLLALSALQQSRFEVVLLDLDLPGVDGFRLAGMIREQPGGSSVHVIAITARSGGDEQQRATEAGMDGFLRKPLTGAQLAAELSQVSSHAG